MAPATRDSLNVPNILNDDMSTKCKRRKAYASWRIYHPTYPRSLFRIPHNAEEISCAQMINKINDLQLSEWGNYVDMNIKGQPSLVFAINEHKSYNDMKSKGITRKINLSTKDKIVGAAAAVTGATIIIRGGMYYGHNKQKMQPFIAIYTQILEDYNKSVLNEYSHIVIFADFASYFIPRRTQAVIDKARRDFYESFGTWKKSISESKSSTQMITALEDITLLMDTDVAVMTGDKDSWMKQREKEFKTIETDIRVWVNKNPDHTVPARKKET